MFFEKFDFSQSRLDPANVNICDPAPQVEELLGKGGVLTLVDSDAEKRREERIAREELVVFVPRRPAKCGSV